MGGSGEAFAFYRVLVCHDDFGSGAEGEVGWCIGMMIWKCFGLGVDTQCTEMIEKTLWVADGGNSGGFATGKIRRVDGMLRRRQIAKALAAQIHTVNRAGKLGVGTHAVQDYSVNGCQPGQGFSQRPRRQQAPVAEAACGVDDGDFEISVQCLRVQTIVAE